MTSSVELWSSQLNSKESPTYNTVLRSFSTVMDNMPNNCFTERISPDSYSLPQEKKLRA